MAEWWLGPLGLLVKVFPLIALMAVGIAISDDGDSSIYCDDCSLPSIDTIGSRVESLSRRLRRRIACKLAFMMQRREFLTSGGAGLFGAVIGPRGAGAMMNSDKIERQVEAYRKQALASFPLKLVETTGDQALAVWQQLKSSGQGTPVVLGGDDERHSFGNLLTPFGPNGPYGPPLRPVEEILDLAADIRFPDDLVKRKKADAERALGQFKADLAANPDMPLPKIVELKDGKSRTYTRKETIAAFEAQANEPRLGEWPAGTGTTDDTPGLTVAYDVLKGTPLRKVYVGIAPTDDWTAVPAWLRWGGWNDCPPPEYHVAAMRTWRDRYGAELVGMSSDTINLRVARRPRTRDEALALAREQYIYCADIVDQGTQTYSTLAAALMATDWWFFWWG